MKPNTTIMGVTETKDGWELTFRVQVPKSSVENLDIAYPEEIKEAEIKRRLKGADIESSPTKHVRSSL